MPLLLQVRRQRGVGHRLRGNVLRHAPQRSNSRLRKEIQRGWRSSMIDTSTRPIIGRRLPLSRFRMAWPSGVIGGRFGIKMLPREIWGSLQIPSSRSASVLRHKTIRSGTHEVGTNVGPYFSPPRAMMQARQSART